jgi:hypothetical protein
MSIESKRKETPMKSPVFLFYESSYRHLLTTGLPPNPSVSNDKGTKTKWRSSQMTKSIPSLYIQIKKSKSGTLHLICLRLIWSVAFCVAGVLSQEQLQLNYLNFHSQEKSQDSAKAAKETFEVIRGTLRYFWDGRDSVPVDSKGPLTRQ